MKITKKIDDHYRIIVPKEVRDALKLFKQQEIDIYVEDNKIIIEPHKNSLEKVLEESDIVVKEEPSNKPKINRGNRVIKANKDNISDYTWKNGTLTLNTDTYFDNIDLKLDNEKEEVVKIPSTEERISSKIINKDKPKHELCPQCGGDLESDTKLKINGKRVCKACVANLKRDLIYEINRAQRLKDMKKDFETWCKEEYDD